MVHDIPVRGRQIVLGNKASVERGMALSTAAPAPAALRCIDGDAARAGPISGYYIERERERERK